MSSSIAGICPFSSRVSGSLAFYKGTTTTTQCPATSRPSKCSADR
jgi:hypothetical protein